MMIRKYLIYAAMLLASVLPASAQRYGGINYSSAALTASTQLIAAPATVNGIAPSIHILSYLIQVQQGSSAATFGLKYGTGSVCAAGSGLVTPAYIGSASTTQLVNEVYNGTMIDIPAGQAVCLNLSAAPTGAVVHILYLVY